MYEVICVYIYIYMFVYIYMCIHVYIHIYIYVCVCLYSSRASINPKQVCTLNESNNPDPILS